MKLTFKSRHRSIRELPDTELPPFTLITGVNGAGKTHLLRAIEMGSVIVNVAPAPKVDVRYFDWSSLAPNDAAQMSTAGLYQERDQILQQAVEARTHFEQQMTQILAHPALRDWPLDGWALAALSKEEFSRRVSSSATAENPFQQLKALVAHASKRVIQNLGKTSPMVARVRAVATECKTEPALLDFPHFSRKHIGWGAVDLFQQSFAHLFLAYFEQQKLNRLCRLEQQDGRKPTEPPLTEEEFVGRHGKPPWEFVNDILRTAGLDFEIDHPIGWERTNYWPTLKKLSAGVPVPFSALSSGEKILMSFALCLYNTTNQRQQISRPKLLLLDEVDAPLHPSMARRLMTTICRTLVEEEKINVVMTTHSPSTVAVAPEAAIFVMEPGSPGVRKSSKAYALALLTAEIPTLSIAFDGRRQVFVESDTDAELYGLLYLGIRSTLESERSLVFIGAGRRPDSGADQSAGCAQVQRVVAQLVDGGNVSVFGLLDWDETRSPDNRIHVLAHGERYSIENCLLDPLLLAALSVREKREAGDLIDHASGETFRALCEFSPQRLQVVADRIQRKVLGLDAKDSLAPQREVQYVGEFTLQVSERYLLKNGHELEKAATKALPHLNRFHQPGMLLKHMVSQVVSEVPRFLPKVLKDCFVRLLEAS